MEIEEDSSYPINNSSMEETTLKNFLEEWFNDFLMEKNAKLIWTLLKENHLFNSMVKSHRIEYLKSLNN